MKTRIIIFLLIQLLDYLTCKQECQHEIIFINEMKKKLKTKFANTKNIENGDQ